ncbi:sensor histidine kinase [Kiloniella sp. b19]|uniref:sensor histidine kinase n=1 Tax=Kiloniella sp. GXU_MW_B19 TaxID=3141326 RepID=UPI0031D233F5
MLNLWLDLGVSAVILVFGIVLLYACYSFLTMLRGQADEPSIVWWLSSFATLAVGCFAIVGRYELIPESFSVVLTNLGLLFAPAFYWTAARVFFRKKTSPWLTFGVPALFMIPVLYFTFWVPSIYHRSFLDHLVLLIFSCALVYEFMQPANQKLLPRGTDFTVVLLVLFMVLLSAFLAVYCVVLPWDIFSGTLAEHEAYLLKANWIMGFLAISFLAFSMIGLIFGRQQEKLSDLLKKEQETLREKRALLLTLSHEIRNPLAAIDRSAQLMELRDEMEQGQEESRQGRHLRPSLMQIRERVLHLHDLMDSLLKKERLENANSGNSPATVTLEELWEKVRLDIRDSRDLQRVRFLAEASRATEIVCYRTELVLALANLLKNALKYSDDDQEVRLDFFENETYCEFTVLDYGIGIPEADVPNVFREFFRGGNTRTIDGTGLGLSVVAWVARLHKGSVDCQSEEGQGTVFSIRFPKSTPEQLVRDGEILMEATA